MKHILTDEEYRELIDGKDDAVMYKWILSSLDDLIRDLMVKYNGLIDFKDFYEQYQRITTKVL